MDANSAEALAVASVSIRVHSRAFAVDLNSYLENAGRGNPFIPALPNRGPERAEPLN